MRKRMSLAQALIGSPELIMLDEPTAGIDPPNVKIIRDLIRAESANATFIISSHNLDELEKLCGSVVYLAEGKLVEYGPIDDKQHTVDQQVLKLLAANGWSYRYLINGRSLEDRLYGG